MLGCWLCELSASGLTAYRLAGGAGYSVGSAGAESNNLQPRVCQLGELPTR